MRAVVVGDLVQPGRLILWDGQGDYVLGFKRLHLWIRHVGDLVLDYVRLVVVDNLVQPSRLGL